jgi:hypothetical protein
MGVQMNRNLVWLHVDEAGRPLRPYSRLREALRVLGVLFGCVFAVFALWCFVVLLSLLGG